ncbi:MAG: hypothetical protein IPJ65_30645 [Archangiaceae bacterium]|nr:hypothetical protein [Archangiaceae bacterium]
MRFSEPAGASRELDVADCAAAAHAAQLVLELASVELEPPVTSPPAKAEPAEVASSARARSESVPVGVSLEVGVLASIGPLPVVTPRLAATAMLRRDAFAVLGSLRAGTSTTLGDGSRVLASVHPSLGASVAGCFLPQLGPLRLGPCASALVEWWQIGPPSGPAASEAWVAVGASARLLWAPLPHVFVFAAAAAHASLRRPEVRVLQAGYVATTPILTGETQGGLGCSW